MIGLRPDREGQCGRPPIRRHSLWVGYVREGDIRGAHYQVERPGLLRKSGLFLSGRSALRLARLDVWVSARTAGWRDYFLLMASLRVRDFRVNALISDRRGRNHTLGGAVPCSSSVPGGSLPCGMLFSTVSCVSPLEAARAVSGTKQKPRKISAAPVVQ